ncbi:hypothetical protein DPMN_114785 [Dreissena polymorpha]|uniref:Uncharacterized protein n=1 Tax=Dreissena polymorpha TaxID=45954 RepID=A0A9D4KKJ8_DREPO|nr:hypothetical protein DPMN_114785 [Dreissena polymorpha]
MRKQGLGEMIDNGERLADLCTTSSLVIVGSVFHHRRIHKAIIRPVNRETDWPAVHRKEVLSLSSGFSKEQTWLLTIILLPDLNRRRVRQGVQPTPTLQH